MSKFVSRFLKDESGATAIEYGLIAALIAVVIIAVLGTIGTNLDERLDEVATAVALLLSGSAFDAGNEIPRTPAPGSIWRHRH